MENKTGKEAKAPKAEIATNKAPEKSIFFRIKRLIKIIFIIVLLLGLIIGGFFLGVYLRVFDVNVVNEKLELYKYPVLSEYFVKPDNVEAETEPERSEPIKDEAKRETEKIKEENKAAVQAAAAAKPVVLTKEEIDRQIKQRQLEEKKRISKLARLYEQMKPEDAVEILNNLNDDMIIEIFGRMDEAQVSKILVKFESERSAQLTQSMYNGKPRAVQVR